MIEREGRGGGRRKRVVGLGVCVTVKKERKKDTDRQRDRQTDRRTDRQTESDG